MRQTYEYGPNDGASTVSGDTFVNRVAATATTTPIPDSPETGDVRGGRHLGGRAGHGRPEHRQAPPAAVRLGPGEACPETGYAEPAGPADPRFLYRLGDRVCFRLHVDFPARTYTRDAAIADFLPVGVQYEPGSMFPTAANVTAPFTFDEAAAASGALPPIWLVGRVEGASRYTEPGAVFDVVLAGRVVDVPDKDSPLLTGNLMKMRTGAPTAAPGPTATRSRSPSHPPRRS